MGISSRHLRFRRGFPVFRACTARLPRLLRSLAMTNLIACFTRRGARANLRVPSSRVIARRAKPDVAISSRHLRFRRGFLVFRACTARLHPKGTSSRFALRAPRRFAPRNDKSEVRTVLRWLVPNGSAFPRLHPKGTSSRFALRAPRPLRGLAMTSQGGFPHPEGRKGKPESRCGRRAASANPYAISGNCYISHSADRSTHLGFIVATSASFLLRDQPLICFSRSIAVLTSGVVSK